MKNYTKIVIGTFLVTLLWGSFDQVSAQSNLGGWSYWKNWIRSHYSPSYRRTDNPVVRERYLQSRRQWPYSRVERPEQSTYFSENTRRIRFSPTRNTEPQNLASQYEKLQNTFYSSNRDLVVSAIPTTRNQPVTIIDNTVIPVFEIGVNNRAQTSQSQFREAILLRTMTFQMVTNSGIAQNPENFDLVINGDQTFSFESNGSVTIDFLNARIAQGEDLSFSVGLKVNDPESTPNQRGALKLRIVRASGVTEIRETDVNPFLSGSTISPFITFEPTIQTTGTPVLSSQTTRRILGENLSAGEKAYVLGVDLSAHFDDMVVEEVTVRDILGNNIDASTRGITALDGQTGTVLGSAFFSGGQAHIKFFRNLEIPRETDRSIIFQIQVASRVPDGNNQFKLDIQPADLIVTSLSNGREVPDANKNFSIDAETFQIVQSGGSIGIFPSSQPNGFAVIPSTHTQVYRLSIANPSQQNISLGRISLDVALEGLDFPSGRSADDFDLREIQGSREISGTQFIPTLGAGNTVRFDASNEIPIPRNSNVEFVLKLRMEDVPGSNPGSDAVSVRVLGDNTFGKDTLTGLRLSGKNFIWSDRSAQPHTTTSSDWLSGYLVQGLPSNTVVIRRQ